MNIDRRTILGIGVAIVLSGSASGARALTSLSVNGCLSGKIKAVGKAMDGYLACYGKSASKGVAADPVCLAKASARISGPFNKLEAGSVPPCLTDSDDAARDGDTFAYAAVIDSIIGHAPKKCDAAKHKCVAKYIAGVTGCYAKAARKGGAIDTACVDKLANKLADGNKGCLDKAARASDCTNGGSQATVLRPFADEYLEEQGCALDPSNAECVYPTPTPTATSLMTSTPTPTPTGVVTPGPTATAGGTCHNGQNDPGEACDESAPAAGWGMCGADFTCVDCNCACPSKVTFQPDPDAPETLLDVGWTGISHRSPVISSGMATMTVSGCEHSARPCGICSVSGPIENLHAGAGELASRRCVSDTSKRCTSDAACGGGAGDCQYFFGAPLPLAAGGVTTCVVNQFDGAVSGTANIESGEAETVAKLKSRVYNGILLDNPCPRCVGDGAVNDGVKGGTCDGGVRDGLACDANGDVPGRPDYGATSLDCPPLPGAIIATLPIDLSNKTGAVTKTLTASSPNCSGQPPNKCLCDTCNNLAATPCSTNADCVAVGATVCGGKRCLSGANNGAPCSTNSQCPGGACSRPGEPTKPASCLDNTSTIDTLDCIDSDGDGEGECVGGPSDRNCTLASGHAQRGCITDADCGGAPASCGVANRMCFLTGGGTFVANALGGTDTLTAVGAPDTPVQDVSHPTLASVFCVGPTGAAAINNVAGLPGPGRTTLKGTAVGHP